MATAELGPVTTDQCVLVDDRFTLVSLDDYVGDLLEIRLYAQKGAELARESLYEDDYQPGDPCRPGRVIVPARPR